MKVALLIHLDRITHLNLLIKYVSPVLHHIPTCDLYVNVKQYEGRDQALTTKKIMRTLPRATVTYQPNDTSITALFHLATLIRSSTISSY
jgi:hypothetical protein